MFPVETQFCLKNLGNNKMSYNELIREKRKLQAEVNGMIGKVYDAKRKKAIIQRLKDIEKFLQTAN